MQPMTMGSIYFASLNQLRTGNDKAEFKYSLHTDSYVFRNFESIMRGHYEKLFDRTMVLCMAKSLNAVCWEQYCPKGGICYEFEFNDAACARDVTRRDVTYADNKVFNAPYYLIKSVLDRQLQRILQMRSKPLRADLVRVYQWLQTNGPRDIGVRHITDELAFKKHLEFEFENEFRFVHLSERIGPSEMPTRLANQTLQFHTLGMHLKRVYTSDIGRVRTAFTDATIEIMKPQFLN